MKTQPLPRSKSPFHSSVSPQGMGFTLGFRLLLVASAGLPGALAAEDPAGYQADFEAPLYTPGSIHGQQGWSVEQGRAEVTAGAGRNASAGLVLEPLSPFSQATLLLDAPSIAGSPGFLDFHILLTATNEAQLEEILDIDGARIGFFRAPADPAQGRFWIFNGDGAGGGNWQPTRIALPVDTATGRPADWVRLTVREDFAAKSWDLWISGKLATASAGFHEAASDHTRNYVIMGDAVERLALDDLSIGGTNQLGPDADGDGMLDADETAIGSDPALADRHGSDPEGRSFEEKWSVRLAEQATPPAVPLPGPPTFSRPSAVVSEPFTLTLSPGGSAAVFYTTDGSNPLPATARTYSGPIQITTTTVIRACTADATGRTSATAAAAWVFPDAVAAQQLPPGWPETLSEADPTTGGVRLFSLDPQLRHQAAVDGLPSLDASVAASLLQAPVVVLTAAPEDWFGNGGVYRKSADTGGRHASGEIVWMDGNNGTSGGALQASISISGQGSRSHFVTLKHSFRITWSDPAEAGAVFGQPTFPCRQLLLRHPTQDSWVVDGPWSSRRTGAKYVTDAWASNWLADQGHRSLEHHWVHVFLNGTYWGVYDAVEQHDAEYARRHGLPGPLHLVEPDTEQGNAGVRAITGSAEGWIVALQGLRQAAVGGTATDDAGWAAAAARFDVPGLIDYVLWNWWLANADWPTHNWLASEEFGKWRMLSWDAEMALPTDSNDLPKMASRLEADTRGPGAAFVLLSQWPDFRRQVAARLETLTGGIGALVAASAENSWQEAAARFRPLAAAESARWGSLYQNPALTPDDWEIAVARVSGKFIPERALALQGEVAAFLDGVAARCAAEANRQLPTEVPAPTTPPAPSIAVPVDSDGDRMPDEWELRYGLNSADPADAVADQDGDGIPNVDEFFRLSDPLTADAAQAMEEGPSVHTRFPVHQRRRLVPAAR